MKTKAAVLLEPGKPFELMELDLDAPGVGEVLIKYTAAGLCHSDLHLTDGDLPPRYPIVGGHEGSGIIQEVGPGVGKVKPGDHVVCSFIPNCGTCRYCSTGRQNLCDMGATILEGSMPDGSFRFHGNGQDFGAMCMLGTFSEYATISQHSVVKVDDWLPLETAVLVGCGVPSGWGTATTAGNLRAGDTAVIYEGKLRSGDDFGMALRIGTDGNAEVCEMPAAVKLPPGIHSTLLPSQYSVCESRRAIYLYSSKVPA